MLTEYGKCDLLNSVKMITEYGKCDLNNPVKVPGRYLGNVGLWLTPIWKWYKFVFKLSIIV